MIAAKPYRMWWRTGRRTSQAEGTADGKSQSQERTWLITAHPMHGERSRRYGDKVKCSSEYHVKQFDLCSVDTENP